VLIIFGSELRQLSENVFSVATTVIESCIVLVPIFACPSLTTFRSFQDFLWQLLKVVQFAFLLQICAIFLHCYNYTELCTETTTQTWRKAFVFLKVVTAEIGQKYRVCLPY
jgi:hypothetical protein